jgi:hypothetical protein
MGFLKNNIIRNCSQITESSDEITIKMVITSKTHVYTYSLADDDSFEFELKKTLKNGNGDIYDVSFIFLTRGLKRLQKIFHQFFFSIRKKKQKKFQNIFKKCIMTPSI